MGTLRPSASRRLNSTRPESMTIIPAPGLPTSKSIAPSGKEHLSPNREARWMSSSGSGSKISWRRPSRNANGEPGGSLGMSGTELSGCVTLRTLLLPHLDGKRSEEPERFFTRSGGAGSEAERDAVHAVAKPGRLRPVVEDVAEVSAAAAAVHLGADHHEGAVLGGLHRAGERGVEARPAGVALELRLRREEGKGAAGAEEAAVTVLVEQRARPRALGSLVPEDVVGRGREEGLPLGVGLLDLEGLALRGRGRLAAAEEGDGAHGERATDQRAARDAHEPVLARAWRGSGHDS